MSQYFVYSDKKKECNPLESNINASNWSDESETQIYVAAVIAHKSKQVVMGLNCPKLAPVTRTEPRRDVCITAVMNV
jgi:hypothetical protein